MSDLQLTATRMFEGVWEGVLTAAEARDAAPEIAVTHRGRPLDGIDLSPSPGRADQWQLRVPIPPAALSDGVQTFLIRDAVGDSDLGSFSIAMGDALAGDIRAEVELLRAELDMLKRAFRRHCLETA